MENNYKYPLPKRKCKIGKYIFFSTIVLCFSFAVFYCGVSGWWWLLAYLLIEEY